MRLARPGLIVGIILVFLVAGAGWILVHSPALISGLHQPDADAPLAAYRQSLASAKQTAFEGGHTPEELAQAEKMLVAALGNPLFSRLDKTERAGVYSGAGWAASRLDHDKRARDMLALAVKLNPDDWEDWRLLAKTQSYVDDYDAAATTLVTYARRWPKRLDDDKDFIIRVVNGAEADSAPRLQLLQTLYNANWSPAPVGVSAMWKQLAMSKIRLGHRESARAIITRITAPGDLVAVRSDKRFDGLFDPKSPQFNVEAAAVRRADLLRTYAESNPKDVKAEAELARALLALGRNQEVADRAARALTRFKFGDGPFKHLDHQPWLMHTRSQALTRLGRFDEALVQMEQAARPNGNGEADTNRVLDLGAFYCTVGRADDALAVVRSATDMNDFGRGVQAYVQHCAAYLKHDPALAESALAFLREHKRDNQEPLLYALLRVNHMDEAARSIIDRLADVDTRNGMLVELQGYLTARKLPGGEAMSARWHAVVARDDVKREVERVGRIEHYDYFGD